MERIVAQVWVYISVDIVIRIGDSARGNNLERYRDGGRVL
jgi:hypothetical protein